MKALVTGGGGFLGGWIVRKLAGRGDEVRTINRSAYPWLEEFGVDARRGDIADAESVHDAVKGVDVVFHVAAKAGVWGPDEEYHAANVKGTRNVLDACRKHGVKKMVHTSTPSVVHDGTDQEGVDESAPHAQRFLCAYPATKARAEKNVLAANSATLSTVALRPHLVWGPYDNHLVPRLIERGKAGKLRRVGTRDCLVDATYVENAADAHIQAVDRLAPDAACAGKPYFIANDEPIVVWDLIDRILAAGGLPPVTRTISPSIAYAVGAALEAYYDLIGREEEPPMTRFLAKQLATSHWFDLTAAKRDLGYDPQVSTDEGLRRLAAWLAKTDA